MPIISFEIIIKITGELIIVKRPESYTDALAGPSKNMWKQVVRTKILKK
ncbi:hypothetical protein ACETAC_03915 [Aceticella autotrophica]|uniref:Uncharacterized protein n=1 Tax=Aceticella autotrophica TaxID=2755338 RepID=A0A975GAZ8_9THEO|nr:hypothetical protein [Aceticella autotrophica]QSZ28014.1 hypothetical protein ACETAC_03915 [Aceticella autotrophica]